MSGNYNFRQNGNAQDVCANAVPENAPQTKAGPNGRPMLLRCISLVTIFAVASVGLGLRLSSLQIDQAGEWAARASRQQLANIPVLAQRGNIYDSGMKLLAQSASVWTVEASPEAMNEAGLDEISVERDPARLAAQELARILALDEAVLYEKLSDKDSRYYKVKSKIEKPLADEIRDVCGHYGIGGIYLREDTKRYYPYESMASTVLGFVGEDNNGLEGIERWYDETLAGVPGRTVSVVDAWGNEIPVDGEGVTYPADDGRSIVLTLNTDIQRSLEKNLQATVDKNNARQRGFAIAMDVKTGAILGWAVYPSYNPNEPYTIDDPAALAILDLMIDGSDEKIAAQGTARTLQWRNKALADTYEPGSVMKVITAAAALDSGVYTQDSPFYCGGTMMLEGWDKPFGCAGTRTAANSVHGATTLRTALIESCNLSFIQMSAGMGAHTWYSYLKAFGLTEPTGVDLPGEPSQRAISNLIYPEEGLGPIQLASCSFGQSNKYTALQMITAISAAVNGGNLMQPHIVSKEIDAAGNVLKNYEPVVKRQVVSPETSTQICEILEHLVTETTNGQWAYKAGYRVAGKSGTSEKLEVMVQEEREDAFISSFVGFAPADEPQIAVLLALDEPEDTTMGNFFGGRLAGPYVGNIIKDSMDILGIKPLYSGDDALTRTTVTTPRCVDSEITYAERLVNEKQLRTRVVGDGDVVVGQCPEAYTDIPAGGEVVLYTDPSMPQEQVQMPNMIGRTAQNAIDQLRGIGFNVLTDGSPDDGAGVVVTVQSHEAGVTLPRGTVVSLVVGNESYVPE